MLDVMPTMNHEDLRQLGVQLVRENFSKLPGPGQAEILLALGVNIIGNGSLTEEEYTEACRKLYLLQQQMRLNGDKD